MSPSTIILVILMVSDTSSLLILDKLAQLKDKIVEKVLGDDNCGCPCREYAVVKCDVEWVEHCYQVSKGTKMRYTDIDMIRYRSIMRRNVRRGKLSNPEW